MFNRLILPKIIELNNIPLKAEKSEMDNITIRNPQDYGILSKERNCFLYLSIDLRLTCPDCGKIRVMNRPRAKRIEITRTL